MLATALWMLKSFSRSNICKIQPITSIRCVFTAITASRSLAGNTARGTDYFTIVRNCSKLSLVEQHSHCSISMDQSTDSKTDGISAFTENKNSYDCIELDLRKKCHRCEDDKFELKMAESTRCWEADGVRGVTVCVPSSLCSRIQILVKLGFDFHHAKPGYVLMLKWLSRVDDNNFPSYANQYLGVGGFVMNDKNELLVVRERYSGVEARWKLPGGGADSGEELGETAQREVLEETGIHSEFMGVLCVRHQHQFRYDCSDFYFVCLMKAISTSINKCDQEIEECRWMPVKEFGEQNLYPTNRFALESYLKYRETGVLIQPNTILSYTGKSFHIAYRPGKVENLSETTHQPGANSNL